MHKSKKTYTYNTEALPAAMTYYNEQQQFLRENHSTDTYLSGTNKWVVFVFSIVHL